MRRLLLPFALLFYTIFFCVLTGCKGTAEETENTMSVQKTDDDPVYPPPPPYDFTAVAAEVHFGDILRPWDGFGFNYVETAQTMDYEAYAQEYGGFSHLEETEKEKVIEYVFGEDGLKVGLVKMFLDPWHQSEAGGTFDHKTTTANMREFVRRGLQKTRARGGDLTIITTLYGPPAYTTKQKEMRGRDLDPAHKRDVAAYMIDWVKFLKEEEGFPVKYISLHNEGEDWHRWTVPGHTDYEGHDYNMFWPPEQVVEFLEFMPAMIEEAGLEDVYVTNGEPSNWYRFSTWGHSDAIARSDQAVENMGIITSHGFYSGNYGRWFGEHKSEGIDRLREARPDLKAWVTSTSWSNMDAFNIKEMHGNIYTAKVNAIIPWAGIQVPGEWVKGDPNPGSAFHVYKDGTLKVRRGYYFYKQITRAGQPGMGVARTMAMDSEIAVIGFADNGTGNPDALVVTNIRNEPLKVAVRVLGTESNNFEAYRTTLAPGADINAEADEAYKSIGEFSLNEHDQIVYEAPSGSVTTFFAK